MTSCRSSPLRQSRSVWWTSITILPPSTARMGHRTSLRSPCTSILQQGRSSEALRSPSMTRIRWISLSRDQFNRHLNVLPRYSLLSDVLNNGREERWWLSCFSAHRKFRWQNVVKKIIPGPKSFTASVVSSLLSRVRMPSSNWDSWGRVECCEWFLRRCSTKRRWRSSWKTQLASTTRRDRLSLLRSFFKIRNNSGNYNIYHTAVTGLSLFSESWHHYTKGSHHIYPTTAAK